MSIPNKERANIIGGSDIAAIMGLSRWDTPLSTFLKKTGKIEDELGNYEAAEIGTELEEYVARKFMRKTGIKLRRDSRTFKHKKYPYLVAHIDRWVIGEDALFEAKTASAYKVKEWDDGKVPQEYLLQCQWYMGLVGKKKAYIAVLIGGQKFLWTEVNFDQELFNKMVEMAVDFKENYLDKGIMPVATSGDDEFMSEIWPYADPEKVQTFEGEAEERVNLLIEERVGGLQVIKDAERELDGITAQLKQVLGDSERGTTNQYMMTWKNQKRSGVDIKKMKDDGIYEKYEKKTSFRTFRSKKIAGQ